MNAEFARTLSLLRQEKGVSQRAAAAELGISQALMSHYENGIREPGLSFVVKACDYYGVSADYLLNLKIGNTQTPLENELLRIFRSLSTEQQELYLEQGKAFIRISAKDDVKSSKSTLQGKNNVG